MLGADRGYDNRDVGTGHARGVDGRNVMRPTVWQQQVEEATHGDET